MMRDFFTFWCGFALPIAGSIEHSRACERGAASKRHAAAALLCAVVIFNGEMHWLSSQQHASSRSVASMDMAAAADR